MTIWMWLGVAVLILFSAALPWISGLVLIRERQVGIVVKRFATRTLPPGCLIALKGEAGYQADTLAPGVYFGFWLWQYKIQKVPMTQVPAGQIALVVAADGTAIPAERILGKVVDCDSFQDARKFLQANGERGRQLGFLTAGSYRINTALFTIITVGRASEFGLKTSSLMVQQIASEAVGIVTTLDGQPISPGEIAGAVIPGHDNFQNAQAFLSGGGSRGLQEQILLSGSWNLNPWFVQVEPVPMLEIPIGYVGVVVSYVGTAAVDVSGTEFKHGDLVEPGHKGVWVTPLSPGKHPINPHIMKTELVPTTNIVLNWATRTEAHKFDAKLSPITVRSRDGFSFTLDVSQIIHVGALDAPKVISRVGTMQNLVDHVLQPIVGNYFRNSAQHHTVLDFLGARSERQLEAATFIRSALAAYDVQAIDTLIGDIDPPKELMQTQTDRKIAEEQRKTYEVQEAAQKQRQQLVRETSLAEIQSQMVGAEQGVHMAQLKSDSLIRQATGEAEATRLRSLGEAQAIRATGDAKAAVYRAGVESIGSDNYTLLQIMQVVGDRNVRIVPDVAVNGTGGAGGLAEGLVGLLLRREAAGLHPGTGSPTKAAPNS